MTVTGDSPFRAPPRIGRNGFRRLLTERAAPGVVAERDPGAYWDVCTAAGVDPLFIAAMFNHESEFGKKGVAAITHSFGNTREPNFGAQPVGATPGRSGVFPIWRDWLDGCKSTVARLVEPTWVYAGRGSIREIFDWPDDPDLVWAPAGDLNDPAGYLRAVLDFMNEYEETVATAQLPGFAWQPADSRHFSVGRGGQKVIGGAQHYSAGTNSLGWLTTDSGADDPDSRVSATCLVKHNPTMDDRGWQLVRLEDTAWATAFANPYTVPIEYEHKEGQSIPDIAYEVLAQTWLDIDRYLRDHNLGAIDAIRGHKEWVNNPSKICPDGIDVGRIWKRYSELRAGGAPGADNDGNPWFLHLGNGVKAQYALRRGFRGVVEGLAQERYPDDPNSAALALVGVPKEEEWTGIDGHAYQRCERVTLHYIPGNGKPWDVVMEPVTFAVPAKAA